MNRVEFRYYQCLLNPLSGDRVTIALLHWDGRRLRLADALPVLPPVRKESRKMVERGLKALRQMVALANETQHPEGALLQDVFRVREGMGSLLFWSELKGALTDHPEQHFNETKELLQLAPPAHRAVRLSTRRLFHELISLGKELAKDAPGRILVKTTIGEQHRTISPVSWKNGRWHHTFPCSFVGLDKSEIQAEAERLLGSVQMSIPQGEIPVVLAVLPEDPALAELCRRETELVEEALATHQPLVLLPRVGQGHTEQLEQRIRQDVVTD